MTYNMNYKNKYLKYKTKYNNLKYKMYGGDVITCYGDPVTKKETQCDDDLYECDTDAAGNAKCTAL